MREGARPSRRVRRVRSAETAREPHPASEAVLTDGPRSPRHTDGLRVVLGSPPPPEPPAPPRGRLLSNRDPPWRLPGALCPATPRPSHLHGVLLLRGRKQRCGNGRDVTHTPLLTQPVDPRPVRRPCSASTNWSPVEVCHSECFTHIFGEKQCHRRAFGPCSRVQGRPFPSIRGPGASPLPTVPQGPRPEPAPGLLPPPLTTFAPLGGARDARTCAGHPLGPHLLVATRHSSTAGGVLPGTSGSSALWPSSAFKRFLTSK